MYDNLLEFMCSRLVSLSRSTLEQETLDEAQTVLVTYVMLME